VSKATFNYVRQFTWQRVLCWLRHKHRRSSWKWIRRRYLPSWWPTEGEVLLFNPAGVTVTRYSRFCPGWMVVDQEDAQVAKAWITEVVASQHIAPGTLTVHADRGSSMTSKPVAVLLADLKIGRTHSRPHVSNDKACATDCSLCVG
jgi:hypothetical protein